MPNLFQENNTGLPNTQVKASLLLINIILAIIYFIAITFFFATSNKPLFYILIATEIFHLWQAIGFWYTIKDTGYIAPRVAGFAPAVDVFITVCGEPAELVEETARAAINMDYPDFKVYLLNDGFAANKENWKEIEDLAKRLNIKCITRKTSVGAKAGNINNGLRHAHAPFFAVFDADHVPHYDFLKKMMEYMHDPKIAFAQSPQFYKNNSANYVTAGAWEQQELFYAPILKGKNRMNSVFMCGTNMVVRRKTIEEIGGIIEDNIAEDFLTSLYIHKAGWKSVYVPEVLAEGLAPEDFLSYYKQQYRWARGSLEVIFKHNPFFMRGLTWKQKFQYLQSSSFYLSGVVVLINALFPIIFFFTGWTPFAASSMALAGVFLPYIFLTILTLSIATNFSYTYRAVAFSMGMFAMQIKAMLSIIFGAKQQFSVTSKKALQGNFISLAFPHIAYLLITIAGAGRAIIKFGLTSAVANNIAWALLNSMIFTVFIVAALMPAEKSRATAPGREKILINY